MVRWTAAELRGFAASVKADSAWFASVGAVLGDAGPDLAANNVLVDFLAREERVGEAILDHFGHPEWMALRYSGPLIWHGPRGTMIVTIVDPAGRPLAHAICEAVPLDPAVSADTGNAFTTDDRGMCEGSRPPRD